MSDDLDPITPEAAVQYYLDARRYDLRETTLRTHESRIRSFIDWLQAQDIQNMNDVDLQTVQQCNTSGWGCGVGRVWRVGGG
jgi:site-specific recombinase XerD